MSLDNTNRTRSVSQKEQHKLEELTQSRTSPAHHIERAKILLLHISKKSTRQIAQQLGLHRSKVSRCIQRAFTVGIEKSLNDLPRSGRPPRFTQEGIVWFLSLAVQKPKDLGQHQHEKWTTDLLANHVREHCVAAGHPSLSNIWQGTVVKLLNNRQLKLHKEKYYLEKRDPNFNEKMVEMLKGYKLAEIVAAQIDEEAAMKGTLPLPAVRVGAIEPAGAITPVSSPPDDNHTSKELAVEPAVSDVTMMPETPVYPAPTTSQLDAQITEKEDGNVTKELEQTDNQQTQVVTRTRSPRKRKPRNKLDKLLTHLAEFLKKRSEQGGEDKETVLNAPANELQARTLDDLLQLAGIRQQQGQPLAATVVSYDEKPGIQAIQRIAPDLPPVPGKYTRTAEDFEYKRLGTVSLLAGLDLISGHVHSMVEPHHRSSEFIEYLKTLDQAYPVETKIVVLLDNLSAHKSKETQKYLDTVPDRFLFVFTPVHSSWLNIIECFFSKTARSLLRGIRVSSVDELKHRILNYMHKLNERPVVFKWRYGLELIAA